MRATVLTEAPRRTREQRYLAAIDALTRRRDRAVDRHVRALYRILAAIRARLRDGLADLPTTDGHLRADALTPARALVDAAAGELSRRLFALLLTGEQTLAEHGSLFLPTALFAIGIGRNRPPKLREVAEEVPDSENVDFTFPLIPSEAQLTAARALSAEYVTGVSAEFRQKLRQAVLRSTAGQTSLADLFAEVRGLLATQPQRQTGRLGSLTAQSERIVRTELLRVFSEAAEVRSGELAAAVPGIRKYWRSARDSRVRPDHRSADSRYAPGSKPGPIAADALFVVGGDRMPAPRIGGSARNVIQCFVGSVVAFGPDVERVYRRFYEGEIVTIYMASGDELTGTPNHPVLTNQGWVALGSLYEGVHVFRCRDDGRMRAVYPNVFDRPALFSEIVRAAHALHPMERVFGSEMDFHGDGRHGNIDVVATGRELWRTGVSERFEVGCNLALPSADVLPGLLTADGESLKERVGARLPPNGVMGRARECHPLLTGHALHAEDIGRRSVAERDAMLYQNRADGGPANVVGVSERHLGLASRVAGNDLGLGQAGSREICSDLAERNAPLDQIAFRSNRGHVQGHRQAHESFAALIASDEIVHVERRVWNGHVHNLQTSAGWYFANGIIAHNCRCVRIDWNPEWGR